MNEQGWLLMRRMTELAKARQRKGFTAYTLSNNSPILRVLQCTGHAAEVTPERLGFAVRIAFLKKRLAWPNSSARIPGTLRWHCDDAGNVPRVTVMELSRKKENHQ